MRRILLIFNPIAGAGNAIKLKPEIEKELELAGVNYLSIITKEPKDATKIVLDYKDYETCVSVGGDGTLNEVAKGILQRGYGKLGMIPGGTGNDLAKTLGIPKDWKQALYTILKDEVKEIDIGFAESKQFLNIASIGFDAEVVRQTNKIKNIIKGKTAYILGVLVALIVYRGKSLTIEVDGARYERKAKLVAVGNGQYYGGGMRVIPIANPHDGEFDICIIKDISNFKMLLLFPKIFNGEHVNIKKHVELKKGKNVTVYTDGKRYLNIDGEIFKPITNEINFSIVNKQLKIHV